LDLRELGHHLSRDALAGVQLSLIVFDDRARLGDLRAVDGGHLAPCCLARSNPVLRGRNCIDPVSPNPGRVLLLTALPAQDGENRGVAEGKNVGAGPVGAVYDYYIERPRLARVVLGAMWGVDPRPFYASLGQIGQMPDGVTVLDVPCGGGIALRGLRPGQRA